MDSSVTVEGGKQALTLRATAGLLFLCTCAVPLFYQSLSVATPRITRQGPGAMAHRHENVVVVVGAAACPTSAQRS